MLNLQKFRSLKKEDQIYQLLTSGIFLANRECDGYNIILYAIDNFFAEFWTRTVDDLVQFNITCFKDTKNLEQYQQIFNSN